MMIEGRFLSYMFMQDHASAAVRKDPAPQGRGCTNTSEADRTRSSSLKCGILDVQAYAPTRPLRIVSERQYAAGHWGGGGLREQVTGPADLVPGPGVDDMAGRVADGDNVERVERVSQLGHRRTSRMQFSVLKAGSSLWSTKMPNGGVLLMVFLAKQCKLALFFVMTRTSVEMKRLGWGERGVLETGAASNSTTS